MNIKIHIYLETRSYAPSSNEDKRNRRRRAVARAVQCSAVQCSAVARGTGDTGAVLCDTAAGLRVHDSGTATLGTARCSAVHGIVQCSAGCSARRPEGSQ